VKQTAPFIRVLGIYSFSDYFSPSFSHNVVRNIEKSVCIPIGINKQRETVKQT